MGKHRYGVIFDAGSSGSRVYVYSWKNAQYARKKGDAEDLKSLPDIKTDKKWRKKVHPGISTYGEKPEQVGEGLKELVDFAKDIVPKDEVKNTPIFLLATAGMRLLPDNQRSAVLQNICSYFRLHTEFQLPDCDLHVEVISGETEGLYGWVAANYLLGGFDAPEEHAHGKQHHTYGFLDMGGASAQIAFAPNSTEAERHANDLKLLRMRRVDGSALEYRVFVTTWLGFGANEARKRYVTSLLESYPSEHELPDPCLPNGLLVSKSGKELETGAVELQGEDPYLRGTGQFQECLKRTYPLLEKDKPCDDAPCLLNGVHTPAIDFDVNHFVGVSEYWHTTHEIFSMAHKDKAYDFATYQKQVTDFCSRDWTAIEKDVLAHKWGKKVDEKTVEEVCFKASWLINMLHDGIGVPRYGIEPIASSGNKTTDVIDKAKDRGFLDPFQAVDKIDGKEVSWTLGKMVLYAASQIPPQDETLAVGFGSNEIGKTVSSDFQFAGGQVETISADLADGDDWHDRIFSGDYKRRIPGILIFLIIITLAVYLLCGRERRLTLHHKFLTLIGRKPGSPRNRKRKTSNGGFLGTKFFDSSPTYERVLEDGGAGADPDDFELASIASSTYLDDPNRNTSPLNSSTGGAYFDMVPTANARTGRTSGLATPATRGLSPDVSRNYSSPKSKNGLGPYSDIPSASLTTAGLGITPFERGGLMSRTESKERLAPRLHMGGGSAYAGSTNGSSRGGSPTRKLGPLSALSVKTSVD